MEVATIDWNDSKFEEDELYEHINAPQWIDLSANSPPVDDDDAWFCRPDCNHPKTADDFFIKTMSDPSKHQRLGNVSEIHGRNQSLYSNTSVKKRGTAVNKILKSSKHVQDGENRNPNFLTPTDHVKDEAPRKLKSTFSARNLFAGNNIVSQITEFCNELKRLATRKKERGDDEHEEKVIAQKKSEPRVLQVRDIQKKPLLKTRSVEHEDVDKSNNNGKEKLRREIRNDGLVLESTPIAERTNSTRVKDQERILQIRATKATPPKTARSRPPEEIHGQR